MPRTLSPWAAAMLRILLIAAAFASVASAGPPVTALAYRADGKLLAAGTRDRVTLSDPATGERLDLESFGPTNAAVFARLLAAPQPLAAR